MAYKTTCVQCHGSNFYVTPENGIGFCFNCHYTTREHDTRSIVRYHDIVGIRQLYAELARYYHSCISTEHVRYLDQRGITTEDIQTYQIGYCPDERHVLYTSELSREAGISTKDGLSCLRGRLVLPYRHRSVTVDMRGRTMGNDEKKYLSLYNSGYFRGSDYPYCADDMYKGDTIILTEGEFKTIFSRKLFPTIGIPGIQSLKPGILKDKTYVICFDSQLDMSDVNRAINRIGSILPHVKVATLPLKGAAKQDIDSFILQFGLDAYEKVINRALPFSEWKALTRI